MRTYEVEVTVTVKVNADSVKEAFDRAECLTRASDAIDWRARIMNSVKCITSEEMEEFEGIVRGVDQYSMVECDPEVELTEDMIVEESAQPAAASAFSTPSAPPTKSEIIKKYCAENDIPIVNLEPCTREEAVEFFDWERKELTSDEDN